jgi:formyl-CoA transferase
VRDDPQVVANEMIYDVTLPSGENLMLVSGPISVDGHPMAGGPRFAPEMGQHTEEVLRDIGYAPERIAELRARRLVQ